MAGMLRWNGITNYRGELITGGETITIIFIVVISVVSLSTGLNNIGPISSAKIAGKMAFDTIDHVPGV